MGTEGFWIPMAIAAASAGLSAANTQRTARRQDTELARGIRTQAAKQREADRLVGDQVAKLKESTSKEEIAASQDAFMRQLAATKKQQQAGLVTPSGVGSQTFQQGQGAAKEDISRELATQAGLMARMEGPNYQRVGEGFDRGYLSTDINRIGRESRGEDYLTEDRTRAIRRNPWIDAAAQVMMSYAMAGAPGMGGKPQFAGQAAGWEKPMMGGTPKPMFRSVGPG